MSASESRNIASMLTQHCMASHRTQRRVDLRAQTITVRDVQSLECLEEAQQVFGLHGVVPKSPDDVLLPSDVTLALCYVSLRAREIRMNCVHHTHCPRLLLNECFSLTYTAWDESDSELFTSLIAQLAALGIH